MSATHSPAPNRKRTFDHFSNATNRPITPSQYNHSTPASLASPTPYNSYSPAPFAPPASNFTTPTLLRNLHGHHPNQSLTAAQSPAGNLLYGSHSPAFIPSQAPPPTIPLNSGPHTLFQPQLQQQQKQASLPPDQALIATIDSLVADILPIVEQAGENFYDAIDLALATSTDARKVQALHDQFLLALDGLLSYLRTKGIGSFPLIEVPTKKPENVADEAGPEVTAEKRPETNQVEHSKVATTIAEETARLRSLANEMYERRARLREGAGIVGGILEDDQPTTNGGAVGSINPPRAGKRKDA
ncbi:hypothetical protein IE53DRAFT_389160 [Violaceomyces palustris]|uniref:Uncharacterized protein n=1 Tax=Violaceomyces palustris TaxID=1673888 RepID=A0ACD0NS05_9BASI|nr:hypothetical protein IE53DRAFT_389160 [Violaceomyces palustris]